MKVKVIAPFEIPGLDADDRLEVPPGTSVNAILKRAGAARQFWRLLPVSVNGKQVKKSYKLKEDEVVIFLSPISGG
jgi:molybdopterin converting factor small subunit